MENEIKSRWGEIIAYLKDNSSISGPAIRTFIEPLEAISYENNILTLQIVTAGGLLQSIDGTLLF